MRSKRSRGAPRRSNSAAMAVAGQAPRRRAPAGHRPSQAPGLALLALEARAVLEHAAGWLGTLAASRQGDGHPVVVFPGLATGDFATGPLRRFVERCGHAAYGWGEGWNLGPDLDKLDRCVQRVQAVAEHHGASASLIGWSLGGVFAREVAKRAAGAVRQVIMLGSPLDLDPQATNLGWLYALLAGRRRGGHDRRELRRPPPVPSTSIYSRSDGIVAWTSSVQPAGPLRENLEVPASHLGLCASPLVHLAIADRLRQKEGAWRPFRAEGWRSLVYRTAGGGDALPAHCASVTSPS